MPQDTNNMQAQTGAGSQMDNSTGKTEINHSRINSPDIVIHQLAPQAPSSPVESPALVVGREAMLTVLVLALLAASVAFVWLSRQPTPAMATTREAVDRSQASSTPATPVHPQSSSVATEPTPPKATEVAKPPPEPAPELPQQPVETDGSRPTPASNPPPPSAKRVQ